jgi:hypothetical protein
MSLLEGHVAGLLVVAGHEDLLDVLPPEWGARVVADPQDLIGAPLVMTRSEDPRVVAALRQVCPGGRLLVVVPRWTSADTVVSVLEAGADACVRGTNAAELHATLLAMQRRAQGGPR